MTKEGRSSLKPSTPVRFEPPCQSSALLVVQPLVGWGMLSAARYPIVLYGSIHVSSILPHNVILYAVLRKAHTVLACLLFLTFLGHFGAVLFHTWVVRDGTFSRMAPWRVRPNVCDDTCT